MMMPIMRAALVTQLTVALRTQPGGKIHGPAKFPQRARDVSKNAQWARIQDVVSESQTACLLA